MQGELFQQDQAYRRLDLPQADVRYYPHLFAADECRQYLHDLTHQLQWHTQPIILFGKEVPQPRLIAWVAEPGITIRYSGIEMAPQPWIPALQTIKTRCEQICGVRFNSVLANWYRHGQDSMGWHADDERELGRRPTIASVSLGAARKFQFKARNPDWDVPIKSLMLENGSLLVMAGDTQHHYKHQLPKTTQAVGPRINLTFRVMKG